MNDLPNWVIGIVAGVNSLFPHANLPQVLGLESAFPQTESRMERPATGEARLKLRDERKIASNEMKLKREALKADLATRKEELKEKLAALCEERKVKAADKITETMNSRNDTWVDHWNTVLTRLSEILEKTKSRRDKLQEAGKDVTVVTTAITTAQSAISSAQAAVTAQSEKTYSYSGDASTTCRLGDDIREAQQTFSADVKSVITLLNTTRRAVADVLSALRAIDGGRTPLPTGEGVNNE
jgi:chromosome segregation ATPase